MLVVGEPNREVVKAASWVKESTVIVAVLFLDKSIRVARVQSGEGYMTDIMGRRMRQSAGKVPQLFTCKGTFGAYTKRIGKTIDDRSVYCGHAEHTAFHLRWSEARNAKVGFMRIVIGVDNLICRDTR